MGIPNKAGIEAVAVCSLQEDEEQALRWRELLCGFHICQVSFQQSSRLRRAHTASAEVMPEAQLGCMLGPLKAGVSAQAWGLERAAPARQVPLRSCAVPALVRWALPSPLPLQPLCDLSSAGLHTEDIRCNAVSGFTTL